MLRNYNARIIKWWQLHLNISDINCIRISHVFFKISLKPNISIKSPLATSLEHISKSHEICQHCTRIPNLMKCLFNARNKSRDRWFLMYHKRYKEYGEEMFTIKRFINQTPYLGIIRLMRITIRKKLSVVVETISNQGISLIGGTTMSHSYEQIGRSRLMSNILISLMSRIFKLKSLKWKHCFTSEATHY
jgi:hypothetical protein